MVQNQNQTRSSNAGGPGTADRVFYRNVPQYHPPGADDFTPEQQIRLNADRARMDGYIATVDPYDLTTIIMYAADIPARLNVIVEKAHQKRERQHGFMGALANITQEVSELNMDAVAEKAGNLVDGAYRFAIKNKASLATGLVTTVMVGPALGLAAGAAVAGAQGTANIFSRARNFLTEGLAKMRGGHNVAERESNAVEQKFLKEHGVTSSDMNVDQAEVEKIRAEIRQGRAKAEKLNQAVDEAIAKIPETMRDLNAMGIEYQDIYSETCVAIGAAHEIIRRMQDEMIPALRASGTSHMVISQLGVLIRNVDQMKTKAENLDMQRSFTVTNIDLLQDMIAGCGDTLIAMQNHKSSTIQTIFQQAEIGMNLLDLHDRNRTDSEISQMQIRMVGQQDQLRRSVQKLQETKVLQSAGAKVQLAALAQSRIDDIGQRQLRLESYQKINNEATEILHEATEATIQTFESRRVAQTNRLLGRDTKAEVPALENSIDAGKDRFNSVSDGTSTPTEPLPTIADGARRGNIVDGPQGVQ